MAHAYTPGLRVSEGMFVRKKRVLPLKGEVTVDLGDIVEPDSVVARAYLPGEVTPVNVANILSTVPEDVPECMLKAEGDQIRKGERIAMSKSLFGLFKSYCKAPVAGSIENISGVTGQVLIRGESIPVEVKAYVSGKIVDVMERESVEVETWGTFVQGIFGIGGESFGEIKVIAERNSDVLTAGDMDESCRGKVLLGGNLVTGDAIERAVSIGARGIIAGGIEDSDLLRFLGYELGVAITGSEEKGITLVVTEGFGRIDMAGRTFELLKSKDGMLASINGATQIRAGVIRPEVIIPLEVSDTIPSAEESTTTGLEIGSLVRAIREPYFGRLGKVTALPPELQELGTESNARVLELEFDNGERAIVPRANVEMIEM